MSDGLAPQTKSRKLYDVETFQRRKRLVYRIASALVPGAGHVISGKAATGVVLLFLWTAAWIAAVPRILLPLERFLGSSLRIDLMGTGPVPAIHVLDPATLVAIPLAVLVWLAANLMRRIPREA